MTAEIEPFPQLDRRRPVTRSYQQQMHYSLAA
jgi:hypothetical protein